MRITILLAGLIAEAASAQTTVRHRVAQSSPVVTLSPAAASIVERFDVDTASSRAKFAHLYSTNLAESLVARVEVDQALRKALPNLTASGLSASDRLAVNAAIWKRIAPVDAQNTAYLKSVLPADGWFRNTRDGEQVTFNAWLIVQHSPDQEFQRTVVSRMASLLKSGDVNGPDYALLYDRTEMYAGRPQRYGSQVQCRNGQWAPADLQDPANVDKRRTTVGLAPMAQYLKMFEGGC